MTPNPRLKHGVPPDYTEAEFREYASLIYEREKARAMNAQSVFDAAMNRPRDPRSSAYREGLLHCLRVRVDGVRWVRCKYEPGTTEFDAYFAGVEEGRALAPIRRTLLDFDCADETPIAMRL